MSARNEALNKTEHERLKPEPEMNLLNSIEWIVLTKAPIEGEVKTRLIPAFGASQARDIYVQLLNRLRLSLQSVGGNVALWVAGDQQHSELQRWSELAVFYQQPEGDLGIKMAAAVNSALSRGRLPVLLGADVPMLDTEYLLLCVETLTNNEVVISPAEDGGYGLLAMTRYCPELFLNKNWGTSSVFLETQQDLKKRSLAEDASNIRWQVLPEVWDVDEPEDAQRWQEMRPLKV